MALATYTTGPTAICDLWCPDCGRLYTSSAVHGRGVGSACEGCRLDAQDALDDADAHANEVVTRSAPRWAWQMIDETLEMDASSPAFEAGLREQITLAIGAVHLAWEGPRDFISRRDVADRLEPRHG